MSEKKTHKSSKDKGGVSNLDSELPESKKQKIIQVILKSKKKDSTDIRKDRIAKFEYLKEKMEKNSDVDVIRECIDQTYSMYEQEGNIKIKGNLDDQLGLILKNEYFKDHYLVYSKEDIINEAIHNWLKTKKTDINLHNRVFVREFESENEKIVANTIIENQFSDSDSNKGITLDQLYELLNIDKSKIRYIVTKFERSGLLLSDTIFDKTFYFAPIP